MQPHFRPTLGTIQTAMTIAPLFIFIYRETIRECFFDRRKEAGLDFPELMKRVRLEEQINRGQNRETIKKTRSSQDFWFRRSKFIYKYIKRKINF